MRRSEHSSRGGGARSTGGGAAYLSLESLLSDRWHSERVRVVWMVLVVMRAGSRRSVTVVCAVVEPECMLVLGGSEHWVKVER